MPDLDTPNPENTLQVLQWAERSGIESMKSRYQSWDLLHTHANNTLTVLLAVIAASASYGVRVLEPAPGALAVAAAVVCVYLTLCSMVLVWKCQSAVSLPAIYNDPGNLAQPGWSLQALLAEEVRNLDLRVAEMAALNAERGRWLNHVRRGVVLAPLVFALAAWMAR